MAGNNMRPEKPVVNDHTADPKVSIPPEVVQKFKAGDHQAFEFIFHTFYSWVNAFIKILTKTDHLAEELTQQVFVNLWENRDKIDPGKNINAYIYTMARNAAITAIRQQSRFDLNESDYDTGQDTRLTDDQLIAEETELLIKITIAKMPAKRRQVIQMSRFENKSNEEIAGELRISRKAVEKHLRLAINELKKVVGILLLVL